MLIIDSLTHTHWKKGYGHTLWAPLWPGLVWAARWWWWPSHSEKPRCRRTRLWSGLQREKKCFYHLNITFSIRPSLSGLCFYLRCWWWRWAWWRGRSLWRWRRVWRAGRWRPGAAGRTGGGWRWTAATQSVRASAEAPTGRRSARRCSWSEAGRGARITVLPLLFYSPSPLSTVTFWLLITKCCFYYLVLYDDAVGFGRLLPVKQDPVFKWSGSHWLAGNRAWDC